MENVPEPTVTYVKKPRRATRDNWRTQQVKAAVNQAEKEVFERVAAARSTSLSGLIRALLEDLVRADTEQVVGERPDGEGSSPTTETMTER